MRRLAMAVAALAAGLKLAVPGAEAATFCVGSPTNCSGIDVPGTSGSLQEALESAKLNAEPDLIRVGPGTFVPGEPIGFTFDDPTHGIEIRGEGPTETILQVENTTEPTLTIKGAGGIASSVRDLGVRLSADGGNPTGLVLEHGKAENIAVTAPAGVTDGLGVRLVGGDTQFGRSTVTVPGLTGIETSGGPLVAATKITADLALMSTGGALTITHGNIESSRIGILSAGQLVLFDTLIHVSGGAGIEYGLLSTGETTVGHVTMAGTGAPTYGMRAYRQGGGTALQTLDNSTVTGFESDLSAGADGLSIARIEVKFSNYLTKLVSPGGVIANASDIMSFPPGFGDPAAGNFHPSHDSPLIDAGQVAGVMNDLDLAGLPRIVDGDGVDGSLPDIGAYEYQRAAPVAVIDAPASAGLGQAIEVSGAGSSDDDAADTLTYSWWFGDGTTAAGATASHAYASPGTYALALRVTDPTGQESTVTKDVTVAPAASPADTVGAAGDTVPPVISRLRVLPLRRLIRFRLSEAARVTIRVTRLGSPPRFRSLRLSGRRGANAVHLRRRLVRALGPGRHRVKVSAQDAAGNLAKPRLARLRLPS